MIKKCKQWIQENEPVRRAMRTFLQAAIGVFLTAMGSGEFELAEWKTWIVTLAASSISAGIAAVMNRKGEDDYVEN